MSDNDEETGAVKQAQANQLIADDGIGGFFEDDGSKRGGLFFQMFDGSICLKSKTQIEGWEGPIETKHPRTKESVFTYIKRFDLVCKIVNVEKRRVEFDDGTKITNYNLTIVAGGKRGLLQLTYMDAMLRKFLKVAPNIDFDRYVRLSAFKKLKAGKNKQLISIKQALSAEDERTLDPREWPAVTFYWKSKEDDQGRPDYSTPAKGSDGSVLPAVEHDEDDDTWDFKEQNKFLVKHFTTNQLPTIKAIADRLGIKDYEEGTGDAPMFSGPQEPEIPVVTEKPSTFTYENVKDAMTSGQAKELRALCKRVGADPDKIANKMCNETDFDDLSIVGAAYLKYRIEKKIKKAQAEDPTAYPEPKEDDSALKAELMRRNEEKKKKAQSDDDDDDDEDDDDWGAAKAPKASKKKASDDDDDDDDWMDGSGPK